MSKYKEESCSLVGMNIDNDTATIKRVLVDENGNTFETEEEVDVPIV